MMEAVLQAGALGAKINGSGGGGTIVILAPGRENQVIKALREVDAEGYPVKVDPGARIIMEEKKAG
jgi:galactokinase